MKKIKTYQKRWIKLLHSSGYHKFFTFILKLRILSNKELYLINDEIVSQIDRWLKQQNQYEMQQYCREDSKQTFKYIKSIKPNKARSRS